MLTRAAKKWACSFAKEGGEGEDGWLELDKAARLHNSSRTTASHCGCMCMLLSYLILRAVWIVLCTAMY